LLVECVDRSYGDHDVHRGLHPPPHRSAVGLMRREPQSWGGRAWTGDHGSDVVHVDQHRRAAHRRNTVRDQRRDGVLPSSDRPGDHHGLCHLSTVALLVLARYPTTIGTVQGFGGSPSTASTGGAVVVPTTFDNRHENEGPPRRRGRVLVTPT
jgi:hypothetical protein